MPGKQQANITVTTSNITPSERSGTKTWIDIKKVTNLKIVQPELIKTGERLETLV